MVLPWAHGGSVPVGVTYDWSSLPSLAPGAWVVWALFPSVVLGCLGWVALYAWLAGVGRRRWALAPRGPTLAERVRFHSAIGVVFVALQGPLHELSDRYLFSAHMVQHLLITLVFPPLFITGIPAWMWTPLVRPRGLAMVGRWLTTPIVAIVIGTTTLYLWHVPSLYDLALEHHGWHVVEHVTFMAGGVIMWWPVWSRSSQVPPLTPGLRLIYLFVLTLPMKLLGALITVSDELLYAFYAGQPRVFGLDPMADQRLGGLIMWLPGGLVFWVSGAVVFFGTLYPLARRERAAATRGVA